MEQVEADDGRPLSPFAQKLKEKAEKRKIKQDCDARKKLEDKLEEARLRRQVQDYDFDGLDWI